MIVPSIASRSLVYRQKQTDQVFWGKSMQNQ